MKGRPAKQPPAGTFARAVYELRQSLGMTRIELARFLIHWTHRTIDGWEQGKSPSARSRALLGAHIDHVINDLGPSKALVKFKKKLEEEVKS